MMMMTTMIPSNNELKTFVLLKYEILTSDSDTWERCESTYPVSVKSKWAVRCAADTEHLAKGHSKAEECIRITKLYRNGAATLEELNKLWNDLSLYNSTDVVAYHAAYAYYYAINHAGHTHYAGAAYNAASAAFSAMQEEKWKLYIGWLIEELCEYESTKENINE